jgi:hypothetical protein
MLLLLVPLLLPLQLCCYYAPVDNFWRSTLRTERNDNSIEVRITLQSWSEHTNHNV